MICFVMSTFTLVFIIKDEDNLYSFLGITLHSLQEMKLLSCLALYYANI